MKTKIIATIGKITESEEMIRKLVNGSMDIARMNFSHCSHEEYEKRIGYIEKISKESGKEIKILQDLQGPRIRIGNIKEGGIKIEDGVTYLFSTDPINNGKDSPIFIDYANFHKDLSIGDPIFISSGTMEFVVTKIEDRNIYAQAVNGGILYPRKGVNAPKTKLNNSGLTDKDIDDVKLALEKGVDYIALSFVQSADDIFKLRDMISNKKIKVIAKIESAISIGNIDSIIRASDAIMIARGDLGVEIPMEKIPFVQKNLIRQATWHDKGSIVATQMLTSMNNHPSPTRAEVSDIANAVWDGADAVMLSDETASGQYPIQSLETIVRVVREAETRVGLQSGMF